MRYCCASIALVVFIALIIVGCQSPEMTSAKVYIQQKDYPAALEQLKREIEKNPSNAEAYFIAGKIYGEMDSLEQMVSMFEKAEELDSSYSSEIEKWRKSKSAQALNKGIKLYKKKNDLEGAIKWTLTAAEINPSNVKALKNLAFLYQEKSNRAAEEGQTDSVAYYDELRLGVYEKAHQFDPKDEEVVWILAGLYVRNGKPDDALKIIEPLVDSTKEPRVLFAAADAYDAKADTQKALEMLKRAEAIDPENTGLLFDIGVRYYNMGDFLKAAEYFDKVLAKEPDNVDALYNKALALFYGNDLSSAEATTLELLKKDPKNPDVWDQLALVWAKAGKGKLSSKAEEVSKALQSGNVSKAAKISKSLNIGVNIEGGN